MNRKVASFGILMVLAGGLTVADLPSPGAIDDAMRKKIDPKASKIVEALKLADAEKADKVKTIATGSRS